MVQMCLRISGHVQGRPQVSHGLHFSATSALHKSFTFALTSLQQAETTTTCSCPAGATVSGLRVSLPVCSKSTAELQLRRADGGPESDTAPGGAQVLHATRQPCAQGGLLWALEEPDRSVFSLLCCHSMWR